MHRVSRWLDRVAAALVRILERRGEPDPDRAMYLQSAAAIGVRVAVVCGALVVSVGALAAGYVLWQTTPGQLREPHGADDIHIYLDARDATVAVIVLGGFAVALACGASWIIAVRAVRPLGEAVQAQRRFVANASHELRTPLAVLHTRVQLLRARTDPTDPRWQIVDQLREDSQVLIDIVTDLLELSAGATAEQPGIDVVREVRSAVEGMALLAEQAGVLVQVRIPEGVDGVVRLAPVQFRRAIIALIDNAIGHTPADGLVTLTAEQTHTRLRVSVADTGTGIRGIDPARVFDRFAHGTAPAERTGGARRMSYGIGLALVREIAARAGGSVTVASTGPSGTVFLLDLPLQHDLSPQMPTRLGSVTD